MIEHHDWEHFNTHALHSSHFPLVPKAWREAANIILLVLNVIRPGVKLSHSATKRTLLTDTPRTGPNQVCMNECYLFVLFGNSLGHF